MKNDKRAMAMNEGKEGITLDKIKQFIMDDFDKMSSTIWMIRSDDEILDAIAKKFKEKMDSKGSKLVEQAIQEQKSQPKQD